MNKPKYSLFKVFIHILISKGMEKGILSYNNKVIKYIWDYCSYDWVAYKVDQTMNDVDQQCKKIVEVSEQRNKKTFKYSEVEKGATPLGGEMRLSAPWKNKDK